MYERCTRTLPVADILTRAAGPLLTPQDAPADHRDPKHPHKPTHHGSWECDAFPTRCVHRCASIATESHQLTSTVYFGMSLTTVLNAQSSENASVYYGVVQATLRSWHSSHVSSHSSLYSSSSSIEVSCLRCSADSRQALFASPCTQAAMEASLWSHVDPLPPPNRQCGTDSA